MLTFSARCSSCAINPAEDKHSIVQSAIDLIELPPFCIPHYGTMGRIAHEGPSALSSAPARRDRSAADRPALRGPLWDHPTRVAHTSELQSQSNLVCRLLLEE